MLRSINIRNNQFEKKLDKNMTNYETFELDKMRKDCIVLKEPTEGDCPQYT